MQLRSSTLLTVLFAVLLAVPLAHAAFSDTVQHRYRDEIDVLVEHGVVQGYSDGRFRPDSPVNRAEFLRMVMLASYGREGLSPAIIRCFPDFTGTEQWYWSTACSAREEGIVSGYPDGTFRGNARVNLAEALKMSVLAWDIPLPQYIREPDHWYDPYKDAAAGLGVFATIPDTMSKQLTRGEAAALLVGLRQPIAGVIDGGSMSSGSSSSTSFSDSLTPRTGTLFIEQVSTGSGEYAAGTSGFPIFSFDALAGHQEVMLSGITLRAVAGSLTAATGYELYVDTNRDRIADARVSTASQSGDAQFLTFTNIQRRLPVGERVRFEVRAHLPRETAGAILGIGFAVSQTAFIRAVSIPDGRDLSLGIQINGERCRATIVCRIGVVTIAPRIITVPSQGNLYVRADSNQVTSRQVLLGARSDDLLRLVARVTGEPIVITGFSVEGGASTIDSLEVYLDGSSVPATTLRSTTCSSLSATRFCGTSETGLFVLQPNRETRIAIRAVVRADTEGGQSGGSFALSLSDETTGNVAIRARGQASLHTLDQADGDAVANGEVFIGRDWAGAHSEITGNTHDFVAAKFAAIENSSPVPDNTVVPVGDSIIGQFRFRSLPNRNGQAGFNNILITKLVFTVTAANVEIENGTIRLANTASPSTSATCSASGVTGSITVTCDNLQSSGIGSTIAPDSSVNLLLRANVSSSLSSGTSSLQVSFNNVGIRGSSGPIFWTDEVTSFGWVDLTPTFIRSTLFRTP